MVFATIIGGSSSLYGPIIGCFIFIWLSEAVGVWPRWPLLLGVAFVIVVQFFRGGVVEAWDRLRAGVLRTERLTKAFGALLAVNDVSLSVEQGTLHSVIGPNGAGRRRCSTC